MKTKTVCLKVHLKYATAFLKIAFQSDNYAVKLIPSQWTPTSLSWLHSGSPRMERETQFKTLVSPDMQFSLSRKMGPDPTPKLSDAWRNCTSTHWFDINNVGRAIYNVHVILGWFGQKRFIIYMQQSCLDIGESSVINFTLKRCISQPPIKVEFVSSTQMYQIFMHLAPLQML